MDTSKPITTDSKLRQEWSRYRVIILAGMPVVCIVTFCVVLLIGQWRKNTDVLHKNACLSNLRVLGNAVSQYALDYDNTLPSYTAWYYGANTFPQIKRCPASAPLAKLPRLKESGIPGYAFNSILTDRKVAEVIHPATTIMVCDAAVGTAFTSSPNPYQHLSTPYPKQMEKGWLRHQGKSFYLFVDGHVELLRHNTVCWYQDDSIHDTNNGVLPSFAFTGEHSHAQR